MEDKSASDCDEQEKGSDSEGDEKAGSADVETSHNKQMIILTPDRIVLPHGFVVENNTAQILEILRDELKDWSEVGRGRTLSAEKTS